MMALRNHALDLFDLPPQFKKSGGKVSVSLEFFILISYKELLIFVVIPTKVDNC